MLRLVDVHTYYGRIEALKGVSIEVEDGKIVCLIGANGAGKSTALMTISGIIRAAKGVIEFQNRPIHNLKPEEIVAMGISQVPEGRRIFPGLTVLENLEMGSYQRRDKASIAEDLECVFSLFPVLKDRRAQPGGTLSGGEQQMLAVARALMARPKLLLLDEPSLGLAPKLVEQIFETIVEINRSDTTIFLVEQNAQIALNISHYGFVMETGRIVLSDSSKSLLQNEKVRQSYLGE